MLLIYIKKHFFLYKATVLPLSKLTLQQLKQNVLSTANDGTNKTDVTIWALWGTMTASHQGALAGAMAVKGLK